MLDKRFERHGFRKTEENFYGVTYKRTEEAYGYTACISIGHKQSGRHLLYSYDTEVLKRELGDRVDYFNPANGIELRMLPLVFAKYIYMKIKYKW